MLIRSTTLLTSEESMSKPKILTLAEFLKLKGKQKSPVVVYFNATQWANLTRDISPGKGTPPEKTLTLTLTEIPGMEGGLATFGCPPECSGPIRGTEGEVRCDCGGPVPTPDSDRETSLEFCLMSVRRDGTVACRGTCRRGTCRLASWTIPTRTGTRLIVSTCSCSR